MHALLVGMMLRVCPDGIFGIVPVDEHQKTLVASCAERPPPVLPSPTKVDAYICAMSSNDRSSKFHDTSFLFKNVTLSLLLPSACSHNQAYAVLGDPKQRQKYDRDGHPATAAVSAGAAAAGAAASNSASRAASAPSPSPPSPAPAAAPTPAPAPTIPNPSPPQHMPQQAHGGWGGGDIGGGWEGMPVGGDYGQGWVSPNSPHRERMDLRSCGFDVLTSTHTRALAQVLSFFEWIYIRSCAF